jgi:hypothetical protein
MDPERTVRGKGKGLDVEGGEFIGIAKLQGAERVLSLLDVVEQLRQDSGTMTIHPSLSTAWLLRS